MQVEIWSDVICPWCYIGKRRFETALAQFAHRDQVSVKWRSFELDPNAPRHYPGTLNESLAKKYGVSLQQATAMNTRVTEVAKEAGLAYRLEQARPGNTFDAHRLLHFSAAQSQDKDAGEHIMHGYFCEGLAVGDRAALALLAPQFGIAEDAALTMLESDDYDAAVRNDETRAAQLGITGVPFFVFAEKYAVSGAQPLEVFADALAQTWDETDARQSD